MNRPRTNPKAARVIYFYRTEPIVLASAGTFRERAQRPSEARLKLESLFTLKPIRA